jgi:hypothetical protein
MAYEPDPDYETAGPTRDHYDRPREGFRVGRTALIGGAVALALVFIVFAYRAGQNGATSGQPPLITADPSPVKVAPENPGGMEVPNQDKLILNKVAGQQTQEPEQLLPPPEQPMPPPAEPAPATAVPAEAAAEPSAGTMAAVPPTVPMAAAPPALTPAPTPAPAPAPAAVAPPAAPAPTTAKPTAPANPTVAAIPTVPAPAKPAGAAAVQFAALKDKMAAEQAWARLNKLHGDLLGALKPSIEPVTVNGAKLYRLRAVGLSDQKAAGTLCAKLKERKQDCTVVR